MYLIETAEQQVQMLVGELTVQNIALRTENARLKREIERLSPRQDESKNADE